MAYFAHDLATAGCEPCTADRKCPSSEGQLPVPTALYAHSSTLFFLFYHKTGKNASILRKNLTFGTEYIIILQGEFEILLTESGFG